MSLVGARVLRKEDPDLLTGRGRFVEDIPLPGTLFMSLVHSAEAHARIAGIDTSAARDLPGVRGVWTLADLGDVPPLPGVPNFDRPVLAGDRVRFVGEPVAVIVAESQYVAADAVDAVRVEYEPLPPLVTAQQALADDAAPLFDFLGSNVVFGIPWPDDVEAELAAAGNRASLHLTNNRCAPTSLEPVVVLADWGPSGLTVYAPYQAPHQLRERLAGWLGVKEHNCRVIVPEVGGGFGAKLNLYPELFLAPLLSRMLRRPVKAVQTRSEATLTMYHGRDQIHDVEVGFADDGTVQALRVQVTQNLGAWPDPIALGLPVLTTWMASGCYRIPAIAAGFRAVVTNTTPVAAYRGAGRPEATYMIERVMDLVADETGVDPAEVRRRNFVDAFPYTPPHAGTVVYDSGDYAAALDTLLSILDYDGLRRGQAAGNADPSRPLLGVGLSTWVEIASFGPAGALEQFGLLGSWESAQVRVQPDGTVIVAVGTSPHGQSHETTFAQICADELGVAFDDVTVLHGDTALTPIGIGTMGSRSASVGGSAVLRASAKVREKAERIAAHLLEASADDVERHDGGFAIRGSPDSSVPWADVARTSFQPLGLPDDVEPGQLEETVLAQLPNFTFPSGAYGCVVEIDRETGAVDILRYVLVDDCGTVINPLLAEGQVQGGAAQGIAQALYEAMRYDEHGQPRTVTLLDYLVPAATEIPPFELGRVTTPTPVNPLGAKGIGESGAIGAPPAVVNAVVDALSSIGVRHVDMPVTPERVWELLEAHGADPGGQH